MIGTVHDDDMDRFTVAFPNILTVVCDTVDIYLVATTAWY